MTRAYAHFIGVGGAGMSGIARVLHDRGSLVTGSDLKMSRYAKGLADAGMLVYTGHAVGQVGDPEVVVVSSAIPHTNPELIEARERGIEVWPRARMLAHLGRGMKTLAVAGTHGKTTTSSMLATMLSELGVDPTFLIGGELNDLGGNARSGTGDYYVVEADESDGSLLFLDPYVALITNIEADHLDHYSGLAEVIETFGEFIDRVPANGSAVVCADDAHLPDLAATHCTGSVCTYGCAGGADVRCHDLTVEGIGYRFSVTLPTGERVQARTAVRGVHNVVNATGVLATAWRLGIDVQRAADALARFTGVHRRFEHIAEVGGVTVVDDYAHHPTEVRATLAAARTAGFRRVWVVFQPHRYTRTAAFGSEFGASFGDADHVVLMEVYSAGEAPIPGVSGKTVLDALLEHEPHARTAFFPHRVDVAGYVAGGARDGDLVMTMGAGDVTTMAGEIARALEERSGSFTT